MWKTNNKGFTLIELMGVIIVMIAISLVAVPSIINVKKKSEIKELEVYKKDLEMATETYISLNKEKYTELSMIGTEIYISASTLISEGLIKLDKINPSTNQKIRGLERIKVTKEVDETLSYKYVGVE